MLICQNMISEDMMIYRRMKRRKIHPAWPVDVCDGRQAALCARSSDHLLFQEILTE